MLSSASGYIVRDNVEKHRFEIDLGDGAFAIAQYVLPDGKIMFTHTEVPPAHEGKGVGTALIRFALASARTRGLKVIPICPFFAAYIKKHAEEQDLLDPAYRKILGVD
jgi:predicted GNAT family acetyltransferase